MSVLLEEPTAVLVVGGALDRPGSVLFSGATSAVHEVETADAAVTALSRRQDVGCVVTPWRLPDATGVELCERVAECRPDVGVVFVVETDHDGRAQRAVNAGAAGYFTSGESDATVRSRVDDVLADSTRRQVQAEESDAFRTMLEEIRIPLYVKDADGRHLRMADMPEGIDPDDARGKTDLELYGEDDPRLARRTYEDDMRVVESRQPIVDCDERFAGEEYDYWSRTTKVPWYDEDGDVKGLIGASRDITDLKQCEEDLTEMRERFDTFASYLSHDLRNPLQVASGNLELAMETGDQRALEKVETAIERIDEIVADLGTLAATGDGERVDLQQADLADLIEDVWEVVSTEAATLDLAFDDAARINEPEGAVRTVMENLLANAVRHGGADVTVRIGPTTEGGIYVADDGPGIPPDDRERVLEPGYTTASEGTGTGLRIVEDLATQNDWRLSITDSWAGGARVEIDDCLVVWDDLPAAADGRPVALDSRATIGEVQPRPAASYDDQANRWTLQSAGSNVWAHTNEFFFVHATVDPPFCITGTVRDVDHVKEHSKIGLMVRNGLDEDAAYAGIGLTAGSGTELLRRTRRGDRGRSYQLGDADDPIGTYRLVCDGRTVRLSVAPDGEWIDAVQWPLALDGPATVGIFACSTVPGQPTTGVVEDVALHELDGSTGEPPESL